MAKKSYKNDMKQKYMIWTSSADGASTLRSGTPEFLLAKMFFEIYAT